MCYSLWYNAPTLLPAGSQEAEELRLQATNRHLPVHYSTSSNAQSSTPDDGQNDCQKDVELFGIINKPLLLRLVGCLYYSHQ